MWNLLYALHNSLPDFQRANLVGMGFRELLGVWPFWTNVALLQVLKEKWNSSFNSFIMPWGHMAPSLEDMARITGLRAHGLPVTGVSEEDYRESTRKLLRYKDNSLGLLTSLQGSSLIGLLGATGLKRKPDEDLDEYTERVKVTLANH